MKAEAPIALIRAEGGDVTFQNVPFDPEAFFTTVPFETMQRIGAVSTQIGVVRSLEDGRSIESPAYSIVLKVGDQKTLAWQLRLRELV